MGNQNFQFPISNFQSIIKLRIEKLTIRKLDNSKINWKLETGNWELGFTLIELLIVIAILGILATMFVVTFPAAQKRAQDAQRQSDMRQYQTALEKYANKNGGAYIAAGPVQPSSQCSTLGLGSSCPNDPKTPANYQYYGSATEFTLSARLEAVTTNPYFVVCSNGKVGQTASAPASATCPL